MNNQKDLILLEDLGSLFPTINSKQKKKFGLYQCFCGKKFKAQIVSVKDNKTKSCGCLKRDRFIKYNKDTKTTHGLSKHRLYSIWFNMTERCYNPSNKHYANYGGSGVIICSEWRNDFINFYNWSLENGYKEYLTIDRENNNLGYTPSNCRWVTSKVQSRNTRKLQRNNTTGFRGVYLDKVWGHFQARICVDYISIYLGYFKNAIEAAKAYDQYVIDNNLEHTRNF